MVNSTRPGLVLVKDMVQKHGVLRQAIMQPSTTEVLGQRQQQRSAGKLNGQRLQNPELRWSERQVARVASLDEHHQRMSLLRTPRRGHEFLIQMQLHAKGMIASFGAGDLQWTYI